MQIYTYINDNSIRQHEDRTLEKWRRRNCVYTEVR